MTNYRLPQWQALKNSKPLLSAMLLEIAIAMVLTDASMMYVGAHALMKIEQGYMQLAFVQHLFSLFSNYCWATTFNTRYNKDPNSPRFGLVKSYWFKTFSHAAFTQVWGLLYVNGVKTVTEGIITKYITGLGLAYMIMADGSLGKDNIMILHLQGFSHAENMIISNELNAKFGLHSSVISHKKKYWVTQIPAKDAAALRALIAPHMLDMFAYKVPRV